MGREIKVMRVCMYNLLGGGNNNENVVGVRVEPPALYPTRANCLTPCFEFATYPPPPSVWPHLFRGTGHEKRRGEQLKWSLAFRLYIGSFPCAQLPGSVHTARLDHA